METAAAAVKAMYWAPSSALVGSVDNVLAAVGGTGCNKSLTVFSLEVIVTTSVVRRTAEFFYGIRLMEKYLLEHFGIPDSSSVSILMSYPIPGSVPWPKRPKYFMLNGWRIVPSSLWVFKKDEVSSPYPSLNKKSPKTIPVYGAGTTGTFGLAVSFGSSRISSVLKKSKKPGSGLSSTFL